MTIKAEKLRAFIESVKEYLPTVGKRYRWQYDYDCADSLREKADAIEAEHTALHKLWQALAELEGDSK